MTLELLLRAAAVAVAAAVLAAPHRELIAAKAMEAVGVAQKYGGTITRVGAAVLIVAAAWGKVPAPSFMLEIPVAAVSVPEPSAAMRKLVAPVREALDGASAQDRAVWTSVWSKAATVVKSETAARDQIFKDVPALRVLTVTALDIGWRRLSGVAPGSLAGLRAGVEDALATAVGKDARPLTDEMRASYVEVAMALAWAGQR